MVNHKPLYHLDLALFIDLIYLIVQLLHPFVLSTTSEGTAYTTGRTANGSQGSSGAYIEFTVDASTPDILYYYCSSHSGMGGTITVFGSAYGDADVQSYLSAGTGITLSGSGQISSSITQYADSDVQSYLSAGTGIALSGSGEISSTITQYANSDVQSYLSGGNGITMSGSGAFSVDATAITGQTALSGSVDTGNDLVLLYDNSATALKKVDVSTLLASAGAGNMNSFTITGDSGSNQTVADGNTVDIAGGTGIDTVVGATDTVTVNIDSSVATLTGSQTLTNKTLTSPVLNTGVSGTAIKDEDNMSSDSATHLATQQSIDAYVDTETGASLITGQTAETSINDADLVLIYDDSASALRKMTKANFVSGLSSGGGSADEVVDADNDTKVETIDTTDDDILRFDNRGNRNEL